MKIQFVQDYRGVNSGEIFFEAGTIVDVDEMSANHKGFSAGNLIRQGRAVQIEVAEVVEEVEEPEVEEISASPAAIALAAEHQIDLSSVEGTGKGGNITKSDIQSIVDSLPVEEEDEPSLEGGIMTSDGGW